MYRLLLCLRYLRTRYIALASIISVTLGVATMIVVNSVMAGFQNEMHHRLRGILADVLVEAHAADGIPNPDEVQGEIKRILGDDLAGISCNVHVPAMVSFRWHNEWIMRQVNLIGIDQHTYGDVGDFGQYLMHPENREEIDFLLKKQGYGSRIGEAGWEYRQNRVLYERAFQAEQRAANTAAGVGTGVVSNEDDPGDATDSVADAAFNPFGSPEVDEESLFDPMTETHTGIVLGIGISSVRHRLPNGDVEDVFLCRPGDDVKVTYPTASTPPQPRHANFTLVDVYESKMSEYDSSFAFVPLEKLQQLRWGPGATNVTSIQIKLKPEADLNAACLALRQRFPVEAYSYQIQTWQELQGPLFAAVRMETNILNILLFMIIAVAGFGILATFFMIVVEKTRDIGILKSLGASSRGILSIFLSYGLCLGAVGSGVGMVLGLLFVTHINRIAGWIETLTGHEVFDQTVYYFHEIPTIVQPLTVFWIVLGAIVIALVASILPALRAARLHPVEALRYE